MNKTCIITFFLLFAVNIYSQTYYYKLTKKIPVGGINLS